MTKMDEAREALDAATAYLKKPWADTTRFGSALPCIIHAIEALIDAKLSPAPVTWGATGVGDSYAHAKANAPTPPAEGSDGGEAPFDPIRWTADRIADLEQRLAEANNSLDAVRSLRDDWRDKCRTLGLDLAEARKRIGELEAGLEPFSDIDGEGDEDFPDGTAVVLKFGRTTFYALELGDFRRARALLTEDGTQDTPTNQKDPL